MALRYSKTLALAAAVTMALTPAAMAQQQKRPQPPQLQEQVQQQPPAQQKAKRPPSKQVQKQETHKVRTRKKTTVRLPGRAPTADQVRSLPKLPKGREYRVVNNRIVQVNSDTAEIIAILGLLSIILQNR